MLGIEGACREKCIIQVNIKYKNFLYISNVMKTAGTKWRYKELHYHITFSLITAILTAPQ
jgi:hypothetical protein